jgi:hypothetical protein
VVLTAFGRTRGLSVYHAQMDVIVTDPAGSLPGAVPGKPFNLLSMDGRVDRDNRQFVLKGFILQFIGSLPDRGIEFITIGDKVYVHGPLPLLGARQDKWYVAPRTTQPTVTDSANPNDFIAGMSEFSLPTMHVASQERLDNRSCTLYKGDEREAAEWFLNLGQKGGLRNSLGAWSGQVQRGIMNVSVCDDGYIHKLETGIQVRQGASPTPNATIQINIHLNDMNIIVPIEEPTNAISLGKPLLLPSPGYSSPQIVPTPYRFPTFVVPTFVVPTFPSA